jgi:monoamine oxidase
VARTPLLRRLVELSSIHAEASRRRETPAAIREQRAAASARSPGRLTRREFLAGSAAAGTTLALGGLRPAITRAATPARIAIVGGGISGLSAALTLADAGVGSTVFEASPSRVGGRMHSDASGFVDAKGKWADGQTSEWCGELIDSGHKTILMLAHRFRLATVDLLGAQPNSSEDTYFFDGQYYPVDDADADFQRVHQALQGDVQAASYPTTYLINTPAGIALDEMSVYDWIESRVAGGHRSPMGQLLDVAYNIEYGAETTDQSALNLVYLLGYGAKPGNFAVFGKSDERYHIVGGNESLPKAIAATLPSGSVRLGWRMQAIVANGDGSVTLTFSAPTGTVSQTFDRVILTLPFAVLRTLDYGRARFDDLKTTAITQLGAGRNDKLQLQFGRRIWDGTGAWPGIGNGNTYADTGYQNTWEVSRGQGGTSGILVDYTGGNVAGSFATSLPYSDAASNPKVATYARAFLRQIEPVYPGLTARWNGKATLSVPAFDPNLNCSYSYWKVGQYVGFGGYEKVRQGNILFAGEHCSQDFQGFMEGGASEGVRAANDLLAEFKKA